MPEFSPSGVESTARLPQELLPSCLPAIAVRIIFWRQPQPRLLLEPHILGTRVAGNDQRVISLPANPDHIIKPAPISHASLAQEGNIGDEGRANSLIPQKVRQDSLVRPQRRPPLKLVSKAIPPGPPASPGRKRRQILRKMMVKNDPLRSQPIEVRRLDPGVPISPDEPKMQAVANDDDNVHELFRVNCDWDYRRPGKGSSEASSGSGRGIKYPSLGPMFALAKRFLGLLEQNGKAFLLKMIIIRQNFVDTLLPLGFHRNAVG